MLLSNFLIQYFTDSKIIITSLCCFMVSSIAVKIPWLPVMGIYMFFYAQILFMGMVLNLVFIVQTSRAAPEFASMSFELNMCIG